MSYRYSSIDIIVGFGMCAIVFGALFLFVATTGTFLVAAQPALVERVLLHEHERFPKTPIDRRVFRPIDRKSTRLNSSHRT